MVISANQQVRTGYSAGRWKLQGTNRSRAQAVQPVRHPQVNQPVRGAVQPVRQKTKEDQKMMKRYRKLFNRLVPRTNRLTRRIASQPVCRFPVQPVQQHYQPVRVALQPVRDRCNLQQEKIIQTNRSDLGDQPVRQAYQPVRGTFQPVHQSKKRRSENRRRYRKLFNRLVLHTNRCKKDQKPTGPTFRPTNRSCI